MASQGNLQKEMTIYIEDIWQSKEFPGSDEELAISTDGSEVRGEEES